MYKVVAFFACLALASAVEVRQCPNGAPKPTEVRVEGCDVLPCAFQRGEIAIIEAVGSHDAEVTAMTIGGKVLWNGIEIEIPLPDPDGCELLVDATCPVPPNTVVTLRHEIEVPELLPEAELVLTVEVINQDNEVIQCFEGDIVITA